MQKWNGSLLRKFDDAIDGNASVGTTIVVRNTVGLTLAVIYDVDDTNSVQKNNPFVTDDFGRYSFFAPNGKYTIEFGDGSDSIEIVLVDNIKLQGLEGLTEPSDLAQRHRIKTTVAEIATGIFKNGDRLEVTDRGNAPFIVTLTGAVNGFSVLDAGVGRYAKLDSSSVNIAYLGAIGDGVFDNTNVINFALDNFRDVYCEEGKFFITDTITSAMSVSSIRPDLIHADYVGLKFKGAGSQKTIFIMEPSYSPRHCFLFGNYTEEVPSVIYAAAYLDIGGFSVIMKNASTTIGVRVREGYNSSAKDIRVGVFAENTLTTTTEFIAFSINGGINCSFEQLNFDSHESIDRIGIVGFLCNNSTRLTTGAGSGNGAGLTSSTFKDCYSRLCEYALKDEDTNGCLYTECVLESSTYGAYTTGALSSKFKDCYVENNQYPYYANGTSTQTASGLDIVGGYINYSSPTGAKAGGSITSDGATGLTRAPSPITAINSSLISVQGLQLLGSHTLNRLVDVQGSAGNIRIQAQTQGSSIAVPSSSDKAITNYNIAAGTNYIKLTVAGHGCTIGSIVGVISASVGTAGGLNVSAPLMHVVFVNGVNEIWVVASTDLLKAATSNINLAMTGSLRKYDSDTGKIPKIESPRNTILIDCVTETITFAEYLTAIPTAKNLLLNGVTGAESYECDTWTYVMYAHRFASVAPISSVTNYVDVKFKYPSPTYTSTKVGNTGSDLQGSVTQVIAEIGYLVPPKTKIYAEITSGDLTSGGGSNTRAETVKVYLQRVPNYHESF